MSAAVMPAYEWKSIPWKTFQRKVYKLQMRIYRASRRGDARTVHRLQRLLMKSFTAKCLAVRTVTQDNRGKKTAGVDGVKALSPPQRSDLVRTLSLTAKARPTRRVWIPKPGSVEQRPLGIPTMRDRAAETLAVLALEPEWEAVFEPNSYARLPPKLRRAGKRSGSFRLTGTRLPWKAGDVTSQSPGEEPCPISSYPRRWRSC
jgi:RNA-directed DNA polymerase